MQSIKKQEKKQDEKAIFILPLIVCRFFSAENRENTQVQYPALFYYISISIFDVLNSATIAFSSSSDLENNRSS